MSAYKRKQFIITRRCRVTQVIDTRDTRDIAPRHAHGTRTARENGACNTHE
jgi:hypothetical protein